MKQEQKISNGVKKVKNLQFYKKLLPEKLSVEIHKTREGKFWAKIKELPYCYTQAGNFAELIGMVNDAVFTHLEVPNKFRSKLGHYIPKKLLEEFKRKKWESVLNEIVKKGQIKQRIEVFTRS